MPASERTEHSIQNLKELYSVVMGLALVGAINVVVSRTESGVIVHPQYFPWFVALFATLLPFYHGAQSYLDETYIIAIEKPRPLALLIDYLILFSEAGLLVWLGIVISDATAFRRYYTILLSLDVLWAIAVYFLTPNGFKTAKRSLIINAVTLIIIAVVSYTPILEQLKPDYLFYLAILRTIFDYIICWKIYFPEQ